MKKILALALIGLLFFLAYWQLSPYLTFEGLKAQRETLLQFVHQHFLLSTFFYLLLYLLVASFAIPGASVLTLAGGAFFGLWTGVLYVSFASTLGACIAFLLARFFFRDWVEKKFNVRTVQERFHREGVFYLVFLRLVPVFPFFLVNSVMGLTRISIPSFWLVSQVAMLPATFLYVNAGTQLSTIQSPAEILSLKIIISLCLLGVFPLVAKKIMDTWRRRYVA